MEDKLRIMLIEALARVRVIEELLGLPLGVESGEWRPAPSKPMSDEPDLLTQFKNNGGSMAAIAPMTPPAKVATSLEPEDTVRVIGAKGVSYEPVGEVIG